MVCWVVVQNLLCTYKFLKWIISTRGNCVWRPKHETLALGGEGSSGNRRLRSLRSSSATEGGGQHGVPEPLSQNKQTNKTTNSHKHINLLKNRYMIKSQNNHISQKL